MNEIWKTYCVKCYGNSKKVKSVWEVSNIGRVKCNGELYECKPYSLNSKYLSFKYRMVHRAVAELFIPNPDNKPCVDHIDGNSRNNVCTNLRWVTHKENNNNPITKERQKIAIKKYYATHDNYWKGKHIPKEVRKKISESKIGIPRTTPIWNKGLKNCYSEETKRKMVESCKLTRSKWSEEFKAELSKKRSQVQMGNTIAKDRIHINNGEKAKMIKKEELDIYMSQGWKLGRLKSVMKKMANTKINKTHKKLK